MKNIILNLLFPVLFSSCTVGPFYAKSKTGSEIVSAGGSLLTKAESEQSTVEKGDFKATHSITKKNETSVANTLIWAGAVSNSVESLSNAATTISNDGVAKAAGADATKVKLAAEANKAAAAEAVPAATIPPPPTAP